MFSKTCEYAIRAILYIAVKSLEGERTSLKDIANEIDSPEAFTAKILQQLSRNKLVHSIRGPHGGFIIPQEDLKSIKLIDVVKTIDGNRLFEGCGLGLKECNAEKPCPLHHHFINLRKELTGMLTQTTLEELSLNIDKGLALLKR